MRFKKKNYIEKKCTQKKFTDCSILYYPYYYAVIFVFHLIESYYRFCTKSNQIQLSSYVKIIDNLIKYCIYVGYTIEFKRYTESNVKNKMCPVNTFLVKPIFPKINIITKKLFTYSNITEQIQIVIFLYGMMFLRNSEWIKIDLDWI